MRSGLRWIISLGAASTLLFLVPAVASGSSAATIRVSVNNHGVQGNQDSGLNYQDNEISLSSTGRFVAFASDATNLASGDTNESTDVFLRDLQTGIVRRVSVDSHGQQGFDVSDEPTISADGRYVAFASSAAFYLLSDRRIRNMPSSGPSDIYVRDVKRGTTRFISHALGGGANDGYETDEPSISSDGRYLAFESDATDLVHGDTNYATDVFVKDLSTGSLRRVDLASGGRQVNYGGNTPSISGNGRYVTFISDASRLVSGDKNGHQDVFVTDLQTGAIRLVSVASDGSQGNADSDSNYSTSPLSADGRYVAFESDASNLVAADENGTTDVFVRDMKTGSTTLVSHASQGTEGNARSFQPSISADGRYVSYMSDATNLVPGDSNGETDVFVTDLVTGSTRRVNVSSKGRQSNSYSYNQWLSATGEVIAFSTDASDLVTGDTNKTTDVFVRRPLH